MSVVSDLYCICWSK